MTTFEIIQRLWDWGHFNNPAFPNTLNVEEADLPNLRLEDTAVVQAVSSYQNFMGVQLDTLSAKHHMRPSIADGHIGPATLELLQVERCGCPDYERGVLAAVGSGNWKGCHGVGNFHAFSVHVNTTNMPSFLVPVWDEVKRRVSAAYAELGLRIIWDNRSLPRNCDFTFVTRSSGWIGLATVGRGLGCNSSVFARFLATYRGGSSPDAITQQWTTLVKHELGHNTGLGHSRGGVMNPSIINGLPVSWRGDPSEATLRGWFGGQPVDAPPTNNPVPTPGGTPTARVVLDGTVRVTIPEGMKPGSHEFILVPKPEV